MWLAVRQNFTMDRGSTFDPTMSCLVGPTEEDIVVCFDQPAENGAVPADITGWTFYMQMRSAAGDPLVTNFDMLVPSPTNGKVLVILDEPQTRLIEPGLYKYDIEGRIANPISGRPEVVRRFAYGSITVRENITEGLPV